MAQRRRSTAPPSSCADRTAEMGSAFAALAAVPIEYRGAVQIRSGGSVPVVTAECRSALIVAATRVARLANRRCPSPQRGSCEPCRRLIERYYREALDGTNLTPEASEALSSAMFASPWPETYEKHLDYWVRALERGEPIGRAAPVDLDGADDG